MFKMFLATTLTVKHHNNDLNILKFLTLHSRNTNSIVEMTLSETQTRSYFFLLRILVFSFKNISVSCIRIITIFLHQFQDRNILIKL